MTGLTNRQAADAVWRQLDWTYLLFLYLPHGRFDYSVLSEFHSQLLAHLIERCFFDASLDVVREHGLLKLAVGNAVIPRILRERCGP